MSIYVDLITQLSSLLNPLILHTVDDTHSVKKITFKETQNPTQTILKKLTISGFSHVIAINHDKITICNPVIFPTMAGIRKTCDGIVFCILDNEPYIIVFDMKSSLSNSQEHALKTKNGKIFLNYLSSVLEQFDNKNLSDWNVCYCIFHTGEPLRETGVDISISNRADAPKYYQVENDEVIPLRKILGKPL